jgi:hypothetical protein
MQKSKLIAAISETKSPLSHQNQSRHSGNVCGQPNLREQPNRVDLNDRIHRSLKPETGSPATISVPTENQYGIRPCCTISLQSPKTTSIRIARETFACNRRLNCPMALIF